ncbi:VC0807 family protein [Paenibacillus jiagnxiensis]|uniref:VC0807 family protein n=1 Tax=Paenibacillus jiagnxiensis TaxID=3228926 RepID=UPI0033BC76ED
MNRKKVFKGVVIAFVINGVLPLLIYKLLEGRTSNTTALMIAMLIPLGDTLYHLIVRRKLDIFAAFMAAGFILSLLATLLGGSEKLILLRESFVTGIMGMFFLGSLLLEKPLIYHFALRFTVGDNPDRQSSFAENWKLSYIRKVFRIMTLGWGIALVAEAAVKGVLVYTLSITSFLAVSSLVMYGFIGMAILWTSLYRKSARRYLQSIRAGMQAE